ncbi:MULTISPECIES: hypothetical protein [Halorubrum]|uniref:Uncharacterized protein n=1 Tax=Halorubrum hochstenium ATCC 700873 TaxID=1227481 RepID=M0F314_9EURY|nr:MULTISPECIES: hypothetical protein [Halorubrum]ELZ53748.1 hypothetical protein C467_12771 [Halorubrum hochstenium ATCC 700873]
MDAVSRNERYHLVCRECRLERLCDAAVDANGLRREHVDETGHRVAVERVE